MFITLRLVDALIKIIKKHIYFFFFFFLLQAPWLCVILWTQWLQKSALQNIFKIASNQCISKIDGRYNLGRDCNKTKNPQQWGVLGQPHKANVDGISIFHHDCPYSLWECCPLSCRTEVKEKKRETKKKGLFFYSGKIFFPFVNENFQIQQWQKTQNRYYEIDNPVKWQKYLGILREMLLRKKWGF